MKSCVLVLMVIMMKVLRSVRVYK